MKMTLILYTLLITHSPIMYTMEEPSQKKHLQKKKELARIDACFASFLDHVKCGELDKIKKYAKANNYAHFTNWQDADGRTPLWYAVSNRHVACVAYLLECKADVKTADKWDISPLNVAQPAFFGEKHCKEILQLLQPKQG